MKDACGWKRIPSPGQGLLQQRIWKRAPFQRMRKGWFSAVLTLLTGVAAGVVGGGAPSAWADEGGRQSLTLGSIDWPPYTRASLPGEGRSSVIVREAFAAVGVDVTFDYMPWVRMTALIRAQRLDGGLSFYTSEDREGWCHFSPAYDSSDLALAERAHTPLSWVTLADLAPYRLGTVRDYVNTPEFDDLVRRGILQTEGVVSDIINLRKLLSSRIDAAVIDAAVYHYLMDVEAELKPRAADIRLNPVLLDQKPLAICFQKTEKGRALRDLFAEGLRLIRARPAGPSDGRGFLRPNTAQSSDSPR